MMKSLNTAKWAIHFKCLFINYLVRIQEALVAYWGIRSIVDGWKARRGSICFSPVLLGHSVRARMVEPIMYRAIFESVCLVAVNRNLQT